MRILHRYVFMEMLKALALAVAAVSGLVCFAMVLKALQEHGLGPVTSILYMGLSLPGAIYISLPLAGVLAATLVYGRLASDSEIQACRASGIPESSLLWPAVLMAILTSGLVFALGAWPVPESKYAAKRLALADVEQLFFSQLSNGKISIKDANFEMTADRVVGNMVYGPTIKHRSPTGQTYCYAPYGEIAFGRDGRRAPHSTARRAPFRDCTAARRAAQRGRPEPLVADGRPASPGVVGPCGVTPREELAGSQHPSRQGIRAGDRYR
jgi:hypothetical protein